MSRTRVPEDVAERVAGTCEYCKGPVTAMAKHYSFVRCDCGKFLWALRPRRWGPLVWFPHLHLNQSDVQVLKTSDGRTMVRVQR